MTRDNKNTPTPDDGDEGREIPLNLGKPAAASSDDDFDDDDADPNSEGFQQELVTLALASIGRIGPETTQAIKLSKPLDHMGIACGVVLLDEMAHKLPLKTLDTIIAANLLVTAENYDEIADRFSNTTQALAREIQDINMEDSETLRIKAIHNLSPAAKLIYLAGLIGDMEINTVGLQEGGITLSSENLQSFGSYVTETTRKQGASFDPVLMQRVADTFNDMAEAAEQNIRMTVTTSGELELSGKKPRSDLDFFNPPKR